MISGFNSDIEFQGTVYHVQTEDKGLDTPMILSLVYSRGEILASKRSPYNDLITAGFNEAELNERLQRQHKLLIAAIRAGRIDDLKRMTMKESQKNKDAKSKGLVLDSPDAPIAETPARPRQPAASPDESILSIPPVPSISAAPDAAPKAATTEQAVQEEPRDEKVQMPAAGLPAAEIAELAPSYDELPDFPYETAAPIPKPEDDLVIDIPISVIEEPFFSQADVIEYEAAEETILPSEAVKIITDHVGIEEVDETKLKIRLLGRTTFAGGEEATLDILIARGGKLGQGIGGAHIMVKILGSSFKPVIYHTRADDNGISQVVLQIPEIRSGRAALLIKALSGGEEVELRHVIGQR